MSVLGILIIFSQNLQEESDLSNSQTLFPSCFSFSSFLPSFLPSLLLSFLSSFLPSWCRFSGEQRSWNYQVARDDIMVIQSPEHLDVNGQKKMDACKENSRELERKWPWSQEKKRYRDRAAIFLFSWISVFSPPLSLSFRKSPFI